VLTHNYWVEIYLASELNQAALFTFPLRCPARVYSTSSGLFLLLTNTGSLYAISQRKSPTDDTIEFVQTAHTQLKMKCSTMLSAVITRNQLEYLVVVADNAQSMVIWTMKQMISIDLDVSQYISLCPLKSVTSEPMGNVILLYYADRNLISCQVKMAKAEDKCSLELTPFDKADKFAIKNSCLATFNNGKNQLNMHDINACTCHEPIQLDSECLQLCLNQSATYVFVLVKPRILFMYRTDDCRRLAKLFIYDFVSCMIADNDFIVLAMNDRRLLSLMIADPDDPTSRSRIQALPSRYVH
jgi:hypothetical protein